MAKEPYNIEFCQFKECPSLKDGKCKEPESKCIYNHKLIVFWEKFGIWKGE